LIALELLISEVSSLSLGDKKNCMKNYTLPSSAPVFRLEEIEAVQRKSGVCYQDCRYLSGMFEICRIL
jgi:hypothetical protein